jgi:hypothetical protein
LFHSIKQETAMSDVILVDFQTVWRVPVFVRGTEGQIAAIRGPEGALRNLNEMGVSYESTLHRAAKNRCLAALKRAGTCDDARDAFVDAVFESGSLV